MYLSIGASCICNCLVYIDLYVHTSNCPTLLTFCTSMQVRQMSYNTLVRPIFGFHWCAMCSTKDDTQGNGIRHRRLTRNNTDKMKPSGGFLCNNILEACVLFLGEFLLCCNYFKLLAF